MRYGAHARLWSLILLMGLAVSGCRAPTPPPQWHSSQGRAMGTTLQISIEHTDLATANALFEQLMARISASERRLSVFDPQSGVSQLNELAAKSPVSVSSALYRHIEQSLFYSALTAGAFDITFASVGHLYEWRRGVHPNQDTIAEYLPAVDYRQVTLDPLNKTVYFTLPQIQIDLGGIAKGAVVDDCIEWLQAAGIKRAMINAGGDTRVLGDHSGRPWRFGIRHPRQPDEVIATVAVTNSAISTSGDYVRYFDEGGIRYHHILNPKDGKPVRGVQSVTVTGPEAALTDALSTAVFVLGVTQGLGLINSLEGVEALIVDDEGSLHRSNSFSLDPLEPNCVGSACL